MMATRDDIYTAIRNADAAGDKAAVQRLGEYLKTMDDTAAPPAKPSLVDELGRQAGLTARAGLKGLVSLPATVADAVSGAVNTGLDATMGKGNGFRFQTTNAAIDNLLTQAGVATPKNATERVVQDVVGALSGTGASVKAGQVMEKSASPVVNHIGRVFASDAGAQAVGSATGAGASGVVREKDGGPAAQVVAAVVGGAAPSVARAGFAEGTRRVLRGGEQGRQTVNRNLETFRDAAGITPSVGQASEQRIPRAIESVLSKTPGGAGVMSKFAQKNSDAMSATVENMADGLAPGATVETAGESIVSGVKGFKDGFKQLQGQLYSKLDQFIPGDTPVNVSNTKQALTALNADIPGAPNLSQFFKNARIGGIDGALERDLQQAATGGSLPYEAIKKLRTLVGNEIADGSLVSDVPMSKWKTLYAALSDDLGVAAKSAGPDAEQSWKWANQFTKSQMDRLERLSGVVGKDTPEKVFNAAMSGTADGDTTLKRVVNALPKDNRKEVASVVLKRMGRSTPGAQNDVGDAFSTETLLTNLNRLSPAARATLFNRIDAPEVPVQLNKLANVASNVRDGSKVFANPSGTQPALSAQTTGLGALLALMTGNPGTAAATAATPLVANRLAKMMTNPDFVRWLGQETMLQPSLGATEINALSRVFGANQ